MSQWAPCTTLRVGNPGGPASHHSFTRRAKSLAEVFAVVKSFSPCGRRWRDAFSIEPDEGFTPHPDPLPQGEGKKRDARVFARMTAADLRDFPLDNIPNYV